MAFLIGAPKEFDAGHGEAVVDVKLDRTHRFAATISSSTLSVWNARRDRFLIASFKREDVTHLDGNREVLWSPGSTELAVLVGDGSILFFSLIKVPSASLLPSIFSEQGVEGMLLQLRQRVHTPETFITCMGRHRTGIVCGTSEGHVVRITWTGLVTHHVQPSDGSKYAAAPGHSAGGQYKVDKILATNQAGPRHSLQTGAASVWRDDSGAVDQSHRQATPLSVDRAHLLRRLQSFYSQHNPEKLKDIGFLESTISSWSGREQDLLVRLYRKYGQEYDPSKDPLFSTDLQSGQLSKSDLSLPEEQPGSPNLEPVQPVQISMLEIEDSQPNSIALIRSSSRVPVQGCVRRDGGAFLVPTTFSRNTKTGVEEEVYRGVAVRTWLCKDQGTCIAFGKANSSMDGIAALGCRTSEVILYHVAVHEADSVTVKVSSLQKLSLLPWGYTSASAGSIHAMDWDMKGSTLACIHERGHLTFWSALGCKTGTTLAPAELLTEQADSDELAHRPGDAKGQRESSRQAAVCWAGEGYKVFCAHSNAKGRFQELEVVRPAVSERGICSSGTTTFLLQGEDRVLILRSRQLNSSSGTLRQSVEAAGQQNWRHILLPEECIKEWWPVRHSAADPTERFVAVAGQKGFCVFDSLLDKWRVFGDVTQEDHINCVGMSWVRSAVLIVNKVVSETEIAFEVLLFPSNHLEKSAKMMTLPLPTRPVALDTQGDALLVIDERGVLSRYELLFKNEGKKKPARPARRDTQTNWMTSLFGSFGMGDDTVYSIPGTEVSAHLVSSVRITGPTAPISARIMPENRSIQNHQTVENESCVSLVHFSNGDLVAVKELEGGTAHVQLLLESVEDFWVVENHLIPGRDAVLMTVTRLGMQLFALTTDTKSTEAVSWEALLDFLGPNWAIPLDSEAYPIGMGENCDQITAVWGNRSFMARQGGGNSIWCADVETRSQAILHFILGHVLTSHGKDKALQCLNSCQGSPYVLYSAELLLFLALERETTGNPITDLKVANVLAFLRNSNLYHEALAGCARKVEMKYWYLLFPAGNDAQRLIHECLPAKPDIAARFLAVVQGQEGPSRAEEVGQLILFATLDTRKYALCHELFGFLERAKEAATLQKSEDAANKSWGLFSAGEKAIAVSGCRSVLRAHILGLIRGTDMKSLANMMSYFGLELTSALLYQNTTSAEEQMALEPRATPEETMQAIAVIHTQFVVPMPSTRNSSLSGRLHGDQRMAGLNGRLEGDYHAESNRIPEYLQFKGTDESLRNLQLLLALFHGCGLQFWSLIVATVLMNTGEIFDILQAGPPPALQESYLMTLQHMSTDYPGYGALLSKLMTAATTAREAAMEEPVPGTH